VPELTPETAPEWLRRNGLPEAVQFTELGGGVSNRVILAEGPKLRTVLKQSLGKLRVSEEWLSDRERIYREAAAMRWLEDKVNGGRVPRLLAEEHADFALAMEAAPVSATMWKTKLFGGEFDPACATAAGTLLGSIVASSWNHAEARQLFADQTVFDQLRIDPYYRYTAKRHPVAAGYINDLISRSAERRVSLVHGDWSPKNLLVGDGELWAIDWEVVHFGDPSFDAGFLLNHLFLKSFALPQHRRKLAGLAETFLRALRTSLPPDASAWMETAALEHLPALLLARVDGKSPAEYLDEGMRIQAREHALRLIRLADSGKPQDLGEVFFHGSKHHED